MSGRKASLTPAPSPLPRGEGAAATRRTAGEGSEHPLVLAVGNPLRSDDGAGPAVAELLRGDGVEARVLHQLGPELCEEVAAAAAVVFLDARAGGVPGEVVSRPLAPGGGAGSTTHAVAPEVVLALAERLHGARPPALLLTVVGRSFDLGERLSPEVVAALPRARDAALAFLAPFRAAAGGQDQSGSVKPIASTVSGAFSS